MLCEWRIHKKGSNADPYVDYGAFPTVFCLKINHGGAFTPPPKIRYKGGKVNWVDAIDSDVFSVVEVNTMMKEIGYEKPSFDYYYKEPKNDLDNGLKKLSSDQDVLQMLKYVEKYKVIDLYVDHSVTKESLNVYESLLVNELDNDLFIENQELRNNDEDVFEDVSEDEWLQNCLRNVGIKKKHAVENDNDRGQSSRNEGMNVESNRDDGSHMDHASDRDDGSNREDGSNRDDGYNREDGSNSDDDSDSQDSDFLVDPDNMIDDVDVDMAEFRSNIDANVEWVGSKDIVTVEEEEEFVDEEVNLEELDSGSDCEYEGNREKALKMYHKMNKANASNAEGSGTTWKENFYVGLRFCNSKEIKEMVTRVAVEQRRELHLKKNDKIRFRRIYRGKVPRFSSEDGVDDSGSKGVGSSGSKEKVQSKKESQVSGKSMNKTKVGGVKTFKDTHKCLQSRIVKKCTASFLSKSVEESIKPNSKIPLNFLKDQLQKQYEVGISKQKVFRAKKMAQERVEGNHTRQYAQLRDYCLELKNSNPNTTVKIEVERPEDVNSTERKFKRVYVCLGPLKAGFKACKMDLLGFDGCLLSGSYPGWILTAVWVDPNNGIYPLAYAIVESENKDSWSWFLECVGDDLELFINSNFTFISDRQKGIIPAIAESFPSAEHRCATSTTVKRFENHMDKLKDFNKEAYEWLKKIPPQHWSRSHFSGRAHCDVLLNNMCEVLNRQLVDGRDKPIITCLEFIREYLMKRIVNVQKVICKSDGPLTPNATKVLNKIIKEAGQLKIEWNGGDLYQATTPWGIIAAIWDMASNGEETAIPESYCHQVHWLSTWKDIYRPPKKRKKSDVELAKGIVKSNKLSRVGKSITCGKYTTVITSSYSHQASQTGHTTPFHPLQLYASPTKLTKATARRMSST
ncbi:mutator type transposase [Tanacetum coccineum]